MKDKVNKILENKSFVATLLIVIVLGSAIFFGIKYKMLSDYLKLSLEYNQELTRKFEEVNEENLRLFEETTNQQAIINSFSGQIQGISSTVGVLEKLAQTDEELLQKYSKVYFLNENYVPSRLTDINRDYVYDDSTNFLIHADVWPHLERLLKSVREDDIELLVASAFRSFDTQASLKAGYTFTYGSGANQFSADQGYSEHQLGTSVDFTTSAVGGVFSKFEADGAYKWLTDNAHRYGFILSYPKGNAYYKFEPWHWRFVGVELATYLHEEKKNFYDLTQREIDTYLIKLFD